MTVIRFDRDALQTSPWKNGGGITREIQTSGKGLPHWRLSIADVQSDGPFSSFPGMDRVLTVIEGKGMTLRGVDNVYAADRHVPVWFSGEDPIDGRLNNGAIQDFNLIYDRSSWTPDVRVISKENSANERDPSCAVEALFCLAGSLNVLGHEPLRTYEGLVAQDEKDPLVIGPEPDGLGLLIRLSPK